MTAKKKKTKSNRRSNSSRKVRYAVIGLGHIAQAAVLPAFQHAGNSELVALISGDETKLNKLSKMYKVAEENLFTYSEYPECLADLDVDVVYVALPNHLHTEACLSAMEMDCNVLCEKPLALTVQDCREMQAVAEEYNLKFMTAYRLHFEKANLEAIKMASENKLGDLRIFNSTFTMQVKDNDNIRLNDLELGGGPVWDIGIYCINAARGLFRTEPLEIFAMAENNGKKKFENIDEMVSVLMRFPNHRLASFVCSFGAADCATFDLVGTKARAQVEKAYEYADERILTVFKDGKVSRRTTYKKADQFAAELVYFSDCILNNKTPEPSFEEAIADVRVIKAIMKSLDRGQAVSLRPPIRRIRYPQPKQLIQRPPVREPTTVNVTSPGGD